MTIRRDLESLGENIEIKRSYGKVYTVDNSLQNAKYSLPNERLKMTAAKERIAAFAATLISPNDILIIDAGSTTDKLSNLIPENQNITTVCYNYNILEQIIKKEGINIIFPGGYYHEQDQMFESAQSLELLEIVRANKIFLSAHGVHRTLGMTCGNSYEVMIKRAVLNSADEKILLVDSSKFGRVTTAYFAQIGEVNMVITDSGISDDWALYIKEELGLTLHIV